jgi:hypothetical protein
MIAAAMFVVDIQKRPTRELRAYAGWRPGRAKYGASLFLGDARRTDERAKVLNPPLDVVCEEDRRAGKRFPFRNTLP